jgi:hypothetical protein
MYGGWSAPPPGRQAKVCGMSAARVSSSPVAHLHATTLPCLTLATTVRYCSRACRPVFDSTSTHLSSYTKHRPDITRGADWYAASPVWTTSTVTTPHSDITLLSRRLVLILLLILHLLHPSRTRARLWPASRMRERRLPMRKTSRARDMTTTLTQTMKPRSTAPMARDGGRRDVSYRTATGNTVARRTTAGRSTLVPSICTGTSSTVRR